MCSKFLDPDYSWNYIADVHSCALNEIAKELIKRQAEQIQSRENETLMGCDGKKLQETKDLYNLTEAEEELLSSKKRGNALVMIGSKRLHVVFEIPEYKFRFMGRAVGR